MRVCLIVSAPVAAVIRGSQSSMNVVRRCSSTSPHSWEGKRTRAAGGSPGRQGLGLVGVIVGGNNRGGRLADKG